MGEGETSKKGSPTKCTGRRGYPPRDLMREAVGSIGRGYIAAEARKPDLGSVMLGC